MTYHAIDAHEVFWAFCPRRQQNITKWLTVVISAEAVTIAIGEHVRQVEELRNQLLQPHLPAVSYVTITPSRKLN